MSQRGRRSERGQVLILMATGMFFVLLGASAVTIDLGNGLLQKRRLQNVSDAAAVAAARELAHGGDETLARSTAEAIISSNLGKPFTFPVSNDGAGTNLREGFEVSSNPANSVRVALKRQVKTMFAGAVGMANLTVASRSRARVGLFGILPISVKRFSAGNTAIPLDDSSQPDPVRDYLRPANYDMIEGSPRQWPDPLTAPPSPAASYTPPDLYDPAESGRVIPILGSDAQANVANGNDFHFWVIPDVRNISAATPDYYNGVAADTSVQQLKDKAASYLWPLPGYPGPNPLVNETVAVLNGVVTKDAVAYLKKSYKRGDVVTAMVYNGTVYRKPSFDLKIASAKLSTPDLVGQPVTSNVTLLPNNGFVTSPGQEVKVWATGLEGWADWRVASGSLNEPYDLAVTGPPVAVPFTVSSSVARTGAKTGLIMAYDPQYRTVESVSATVIVGSDAVFSVSCEEAFRRTEQGSGTQFTLSLAAENGYSPHDVTTTVAQWYSIDPADPMHPTSLSGPPTGMSVDIPSNYSPTKLVNKTSVKPSVLTSTGTPTGTYLVKLILSDGTASRNQEVYLMVEVIPAGSGTVMWNASSFVQVLGYANFVITYHDNSATEQNPVDSNTVFGYAASGLVADPADLSRGLTPRLVGWSQ